MNRNERIKKRSNDYKENGFIDCVKSDVNNLFIKLTFIVLFFTSE